MPAEIEKMGKKLGSILERLEERLEGVLAVLSGTAVILIMFGFVINVILRWLRVRSLPGVEESSTLLIVIAVFLGLAACQAKKEHVRMDIIVSRFSHGRQVLFDAIVYLMCLIFTILLIYSTGQLAITSWKIREAYWGLIHYPVYPSRILIVVGFVFFALRFLADFSKAVKELR